MDMVLRYRGRVIRESDVAVIRELIQQYPTASRRKLFARAMRNLELGSAQWLGVRHDMPGLDAGAGTCGPYRATAGKIETG